VEVKGQVEGQRIGAGSGVDRCTRIEARSSLKNKFIRGLPQHRDPRLKPVGYRWPVNLGATISTVAPIPARVKPVGYRWPVNGPTLELRLRWPTRLDGLDELIQRHCSFSFLLLQVIPG
jgi:hypothetical protein